MRAPATAKQGGFTLIEAIIVIVLLGILGAIVAVFIRMPVQGYVDSVARAELSDAADLALRRMARDLRLALPNSIRVNGAKNSIEFLLTKTGGRYLSIEDGVADGSALDFIDKNMVDVSIVGAMPTGKQAIDVNSDFLVVYNLGPGFEPANAYMYGEVPPAVPNRNIARIVGVVPSANLISLLDNPFARQDPPMASPDQRFQVVSGPVTYYCGPDSSGVLVLSRQSDYAISAAQVTPPLPNTQPCGAETQAPRAGRRCLIANPVTNCKFEYSQAANGHSALVVLTLELPMRNSPGNSIRLVHQVHVDNTP